ncbi:MAG: PilW family protein [Acidithiobacillus sp.]|nr:PilW family protein [Acidithiobacillus sp.]
MDKYQWSRSQGLSLVELLVALAVVGLFATAVFTFFLQTSQSVGQQSASGEMWQRGRSAMALLRQAIESAGYGLPSYSQCPNGVVGINDLTGTANALTAITASPITVSGVNTWQINTVIGGGSYGGDPATTVLSQQGTNISVANAAPLNPGDIAMIALPGIGVCVQGQITNVAGKGTLNNSCTVTGNANAQGNGTVVFNSGKGNSTCFQANPNQLFSLVNTTSAGNVSSSAFAGANLYDLGAQDFLFQTFQIQENPAGSTPTLYLTQYTGLQSTAPAPQALATGVVDLQLLYGLGSNGSVQKWVSPSNYTPSAAQQIIAVQLALLIRGTQYLPNSRSPASFNLLGQTYTVPTSNGPGCLQGNCRHYEYHLFQTIIPVRNGIWQGN